MQKNNKPPGTNRRRFLKQAAVLTGSAWPALSPDLLRAQSASPDSLLTQRLSDKALFVQGPHSNVLVVDSSEGLILVDGGHARDFDSLQQVIAQTFPQRPYRALINTHWHAEQSGANLPLGAQGVELIAHANTRLWQSTTVEQRWSGETFAPLPPAARPGTTVLDDTTLQLGDRRVHLGYMRNAHTDGDLWVYVEDEDILVTGGLVSNGNWPDIDWWTGGFIGGMLDGFVSLLSVPGAATRIVPAYGPVMDLAQLRTQNQMYLNVFDRLHAAFIQAHSLEDVLAQGITAGYDAAMGDPTRFLTLAFDSIQGHIRDPQSDRILNIP